MAMAGVVDHGHGDAAAGDSYRPGRSTSAGDARASTDALLDVRQHIESYNYFIDTDLQKIVFAQANKRVTLDQVTPEPFYLEYHSINGRDSQAR